MAVSSSEAFLQRLADQDALYRLIAGRYCRSVDELDWRTYRGVFTDEIETDFSSEWLLRHKWEGKEAYHGDLPPPAKMTADSWTEFAKISEGFDALQHLAANFDYQIDGDLAVVK